MNTWRDAYESLQQNLNLILKDYWRKISVTYLTNDWFPLKKLVMGLFAVVGLIKKHFK
jgi:hypothetical protein